MPESITRTPETVVSERYVEPPEGTYFIHGLGGWTKNSRIGVIPHQEISCSLQEDGKTEPFRPFGYVVVLRTGAIRAASSRDMATIRTSGEKIPQLTGTMIFGEDNLGELIDKTPFGKHNEMLVDPLKMDIVGAFVLEEMPPGTPGVKKFLHACREKRMEIRIVPKPRKEEAKEEI